MADDSMEISSDHDHLVGDGDIDIDIDFTTTQVDEDYVFEDAALNTEYGEDFHPQPSPAVGNDDLMIDEDGESYNMDDADLLRDEDGQTIEHEAMPFADDDTLQYEEDQSDAVQLEAADANRAVEYTHQELSEHQAVDQDDTLAISEAVPDQSEGQAGEATAPDAEEAPPKLGHHDAQTASPSKGSPKSATALQIPRSPPASNPEPGPISPEHSSNYPESTMTPSLSADAGEMVQPTSLDRTIIFPPPPNVVIFWRGEPFDLFSSSPHDDINSFFLSDTSVADKPLADLFLAFRKVLEQEITEEDELFLSVEELDISTQESSPVFNTITLTQLLILREKLLRNDGVESPHPLAIALGSRHNFSKRLETLTAGAAEGKGLSEYISWDEPMENLDDVDEAEEGGNGVESLESQEHDAISGLEDETDHGFEASALEEPILVQEHEVGPEPTDYTNSGATELTAASGNGSTQELNSTGGHHSLEVAERDGNAAKEVYDEDDLIDYSEDEADAIAAVQTKSHPTDDHRTNHEYQAKDEELRRRSISLSLASGDKVAEQVNAHEQDSEQAPTVTAGHDNEETYAEENGNEYEEKSEHHEVFDYGDLNAAHEEITDRDLAATASLQQYDGGASREQYDDTAPLKGDEFGAEGEYADDSVTGDSFDVFGTDTQEYDYGGEGTFENGNGDHYSLQVNSLQLTSTEAEGGHPGADLWDDNLEQAETAESSVTVDADEIQYEDGPDEEVFDNSKNDTVSQALNSGTEQSVGIEYVDEIDYEDDEDEDEVDKAKDSGATTPLTTAPALPSSNGKRTRAEVDLDESLGSKDAKRHRS